MQLLQDKYTVIKGGKTGKYTSNTDCNNSISLQERSLKSKLLFIYSFSTIQLVSGLHSAEEARKTGFPSVDTDDLSMRQLHKLFYKLDKMLCNCQCFRILTRENEGNMEPNSVLTVKFMKIKGESNPVLTNCKGDI